MSHLVTLNNLEHRFRLSLLWGVRYRSGAKFDQVTDDHPIGHYADAAEYVRWLVLHASGRELDLPGDALEQHVLILQKGFPISGYRAALRDKSGAAFICFFRASGRRPAHVWLLHNGRSMECRKGAGISSRPGISLALMGRKVYCYRLSE